MRLLVLLFCFFFCVKARTQSLKIPIDTARWYQVNRVSGTLAKLFDGNKDSKAFTGWNKMLYNYDAYYFLENGERMTIDSVRIYDKEGVFTTAPLTVYAITANWERKPVAVFTGERYNVWVGPYPSRPTVFKLDTAIKNIRGLQLNISDNNFPGEIELYGSYTSPNVPVLNVAPKDVPLKNLFGINGFAWNLVDGNTPMNVSEPKMKAIKSFGGFRQYLDWEKMEEVEGRYTFSPQTGGGWGLDTIYKRLQAAGIEVLATIQNIPPWMVATYPDSLKAKDNNPVRYGKSYSDPASYLEQAKLGFQYAARYGGNKNIDSNLVSVYSVPAWPGQAVNKRQIGMNLIRYIECGNEADKYWKGRKGYLTGREYAANLSAFYDGNKGTMGAGVGVKAADTAIKVVVTGLASTSPDYIKGIIDWCKEFRGYKPDGSMDLCFDVINFHLYSNDAANSQDGGATRGAAPELSNFIRVARDFTGFAQRYVNNLPVWITEQGYDVNGGSPYKAISISNKTALQTQADWVLRSALLCAREGLHRSFFFQAYDTDTASATKFATMGLLNKSDYSRKPAADFLYQTIKLFGDFRFQETLNSDPFVDRYDDYNGQDMYALVVPDEKGRTANYNLLLSGADSAIVYTPMAGRDEMLAEKKAVVNGYLSLTVTETPVFVAPSFASSDITARLPGNAVVEKKGHKQKKKPLSSSVSINAFNRP